MFGPAFTATVYRWLRLQGTYMTMADDRVICHSDQVTVLNLALDVLDLALALRGAACLMRDIRAALELGLGGAACLMRDLRASRRSMLHSGLMVLVQV